MTDKIDADGLQVSTSSELAESLTASWKEVYGDDASVEQNTPDGQLINIIAQGQADIRELLVQLYNSFDPDQASGRLLDERCAINNVFRKPGSFTTVDITVVTDRTVSLQGVDADFNDVNATGYTVQDNAGNQFILVNSVTLNAGTHSLLFRAQQLGRVETTIGTITTPVTVVLGVVSVNNPTAPVVIGENEETDTELKIRRRQSVSISSSGYLNGLLAYVLQLTGVTDAALYENYTSQTDELGIPPHCVWLIVEGGSSSDIANALYTKKSYGCDMRGNITYEITTPTGQQFIAKWDESNTQPLYLKFSIYPLKSGITFDEDAIKSYIYNNTSFMIGKYADTSALTCIAQEAIDSAGGEGLALEVLISTDNSTWVEYVKPAASAKLALADIQITVQSRS